jgi:hypothetical protein
MFNASRFLHLPAVLAAVVLTATPACASYGRSYGYGQPGFGRVDDRAYRNGYNEGRKEGESDARRGRSADYGRHEDYRDADDGFRGGNKNAYRQAYRQGFAEGYNDSYRRFARNDRNDRYDRRGPVFGGPSRGQANSPAAAVGFRDGLSQGREDARDRRRFDPVRASRYRSGDHEYNNRYGSRDQYKREYRDAFQQGYEQGYRSERR